MNGGPLHIVSINNFLQKKQERKGHFKPKNMKFLFAGFWNLGTLPRLMELDVLINALNMQPYFNYSIQLSVSVVPSISITIALVTVLWHISISKYSLCSPLVSPPLH